MKMPNTIEQEINQIRLQIYEQTKDMTPAQLTEYYKQSTEDTIKEYGFKVVTKTEVSNRVTDNTVLSQIRISICEPPADHFVPDAK
jgi:beta-lactam-binding protein with PASTA domain